MKKIFLVCLSCLISYGVVAQISIVPKAGVGLGWLNAKTKEIRKSQESRLGLSAGMEVNVGLGKSLSLQTGLLYTQKGFVMNSPMITNDLGGIIFPSFDMVYRLNYIEMPILLRKTFGSKKLQPYLQAGVSVGYGLNGKTKVKSDDKIVYDFLGAKNKVRFGQIPDDGSGDIIYLDINRVDVGLQAGGGLLYKVGKGHLNFDVRFDYGLTNMYKFRINTDNNYNKKRLLAFTFGYQLPLGSK
jgi:hypothetical protein